MNGFEDFLRYQAFAARWVPDVLKVLAFEARKNLSTLFGEQLQSAMVLGLLADSSNDRQRLNELLSSSEQIKSNMISAVVPELDFARFKEIESWDARRDAWLKLVSFNDHGMDGDLALKAFKDAKNSPNLQLTKLSDQIYKSLEPSIRYVGLLNGCTRHDAFCALLEEMSVLIRDVSVAGKFYPSEIPGSKKMQDALLNLRDSESWFVVKEILALREESDIAKRFQRANKIDGVRLDAVVEVLKDWSIFYNYVMPRLESENKQWGGDILKQSQNSVTSLLDDLLETVIDLQEANNESA